MFSHQLPANPTIGNSHRVASVSQECIVLHWSKLNLRAVFSPWPDSSIYSYGNLKWKLQNKASCGQRGHTGTLPVQKEELTTHTWWLPVVRAKLVANVAKDMRMTVSSASWATPHSWAHSRKQDETLPAHGSYFSGAYPALLTGRPSCLFTLVQRLRNPDFHNFSPFHRMRLSRTI